MHSQTAYFLVSLKVSLAHATEDKRHMNVIKSVKY